MRVYYFSFITIGSYLETTSPNLTIILIKIYVKVILYKLKAIDCRKISCSICAEGENKDHVSCHGGDHLSILWMLYC
jgi:hypothetical protein